MLLLVVPLLPLVAAMIELGAFIYARKYELSKASPSILVLVSIKYGVFGAAASLLLTIGWMYWYESSSGYSAGNAPAGWILFLGPLSFSMGQIAALVQWWKNAL